MTFGFCLLKVCKNRIRKYNYNDDDAPWVTIPAINIELINSYYNHYQLDQLSLQSNDSLLSHDMVSIDHPNQHPNHSNHD